MRKLLALVASTLVLSFSGCSSKSAEAADVKKDAPAEKMVSAYLLGAYADADAAQAKLKEAGFDVVAVYDVDRSGKHTSIVFTNAAMKAAANKTDRGFAAILRLLVNSEKQEISITNPVYFGKAFMQDDFDYQAALSIEKSLTGAFGELKGSEDKWEFETLPDYHFMMGMPYYKESAVLAEGETADLLEKAKTYKDGKNMLFELNIGEGRTLVGYALGRRTSKFAKKIGYDKSQLLPYTVLIEEGKAKALAPKYYIAVSYPLLTMGEFMKIATVPGAVVRDLERPFK
ncbi:MAG: hypothetical protein MUP09_01725 [Thiovulaceae bacterium]|nr:hypothetical protein [Sulfurimonadaceae bacterium]